MYEIHVPVKTEYGTDSKILRFITTYLKFQRVQSVQREFPSMLTAKGDYF